MATYPKAFTGKGINPFDINARSAFIFDIETNFSLIAPAGVGKTQSIVQRILEITRLCPDKLSCLVVVTYTRRAADEMRNRVHNALITKCTSQKTFMAVEQMFFGTIHAFCARLLRTYGSFLGLPDSLNFNQNPTQIWKEFLLSSAGEKAIEIGVTTLGNAGRHIRMQDLLNIPPSTVCHLELQSPCLPELNFSALLSESQILEARSNARQKIKEGQHLARQWLEKFQSNLPFLPLPRYGHGGKKFLTVWDSTFAPLRSWVHTQREKTLHVIAHQYQRYRMHHGKLLYSDQITIAAKLLKHPKIGPILRSKNLYVILDEAQDTDPLQFEILFEIANGHLTMVGDPQQSIYGDRASLKTYHQFRKKLCESSGQELCYHVTFRCSTAIANFINQVGPEMFNGNEGQVTFTPLRSAYKREQGQVLRIPIPFQGGKISPKDAKWLVAHAVANWLIKTGFRALYARDWHEVAILCPRKRWLETLATALQAKAIPVQIHSEHPTLGSTSTYAWWSALFWVLSHPNDSFEVAGVLREIFAIKDSVLAAICNGNALRLRAMPSSEFPTLRLLGRLAQQVKKLSLRSMVELAIRKTHLLERLLSLPGEDAALQQRQHAELLVKASDAEARGSTLKEFSQELRSNLESRLEMAPVCTGAVQLITCHMAKGLEWDAVLVPYFHRKISFRSISNGWPVFEEETITLHRERMQEMQRILYVTFSRARNTLVIFDDCHCFSLSNRKTFSFAQILGRNGLQAFKALPHELSTIPCSSPVSVYSSCKEQQSAVQEPLSSTRPPWLEDAHRLALYFSKRHTPPHSSTSWVQEENVDFVHPICNKTIVDYDVWWHETANTLPFQDVNWLTKLDIMLLECPNPHRGAREWKNFSRTELAQRLSNRNYTLYREMPFFFPRMQTITEGTIDLVALHHIQNRCLLIDWQTDRDIQTPSIFDQYREYLATCLHFIYTSTGMEVEAGFYTVSTGQWTPIARSQNRV